jgi:hypothetical protein
MRPRSGQPKPGVDRCATLPLPSHLRAGAANPNAAKSISRDTPLLRQLSGIARPTTALALALAMHATVATLHRKPLPLQPMVARKDTPVRIHLVDQPATKSALPPDIVAPARLATESRLLQSSKAGRATGSKTRKLEESPAFHGTIRDREP